MSNSIEVEAGTEIEIEPRGSISVEVLPTAEVVKQEYKVEIEPRSYAVLGDDIYMMNRTDAPPQWFEDILHDSLYNSDLANDVNDLQNRFNNFNDGFIQEIRYLKEYDNALGYRIDNLKVTTDNNVAGIQRLDIVKTTADEARAISQTTIGAWQNSTSGGGAWFDSKISVVSNVAYSAAKSASTLTASIDSQQKQLAVAYADIDVLQKQVDGKVETFFGTDSPVYGDGTIDESVFPFSSWTTLQDKLIHTGDTYVYYELDANNKKKILATFRFSAESNAVGVYDFSWDVFADDMASEAYNIALQAQDTADGKVVTWYQTYPPAFNTTKEKQDGTGDIWIDSDDNNKMYRYDGTYWKAVDDTRISASVTRLDEATVDVNGEVRAKSSLSVDANGSIAGFVAESDGSTSAFKIFADKFTIANSQGSDVGAPFTVDTTTNKIKFIGEVEFSSITGSDDIVMKPDLINPGSTIINGDNIQTGTINANKIIANTSLSSPLINGGTINAGVINGAEINGAFINGAVIKASWIDYSSSGTLTNWKYFKSIYSIPAAYIGNFAKNTDGSYLVDDGGYYRLPKQYPVTVAAPASSSPYDIPIYHYGDYKTSSQNRLMDSTTKLLVTETDINTSLFSYQKLTHVTALCFEDSSYGARETTVLWFFGSEIKIIYDTGYYSPTYRTNGITAYVYRNGSHVFTFYCAGPESGVVAVATREVYVGAFKIYIRLESHAVKKSEDCSDEQGAVFWTEYTNGVSVHLGNEVKTVNTAWTGVGIRLISSTSPIKSSPPIIKEI